MRALVVLGLALVVAGCSKTASSPPSTASQSGGAATASATPVATSSNSGGGCDSRIGQADVQPLLSGPITSAKPAPSDPDSCVFSTAGFSSISITVRPDGGRQTLESWHKGPVTPVGGGADCLVTANMAGAYDVRRRVRNGDGRFAPKYLSRRGEEFLA